jgi:hypothetical protein
MRNLFFFLHAPAKRQTFWPRAEPPTGHQFNSVWLPDFILCWTKCHDKKINKKKYELENKKKWTVVNNKIYHKRNVFRLAVVAGSVDFSIGRKWQHETLGRQKNDRKDPTWSCSLLPSVSLTPLLLECIYFPRLLAPNGSRVTKRVEFKRWTEISRC